MNSQPAMPDPDRLVRRSMAIVRRMAGTNAFTAASIVHAVTIELCSHHIDAGEPVPAWVAEVNMTAIRYLRDLAGVHAGELRPDFPAAGGRQPQPPDSNAQ